MGYKTKQREYILAFLQNSEGRHITVAELVRHLQDNATPVGTATVYRTLEQLVEEGMEICAGRQEQRLLSVPLR